MDVTNLPVLSLMIATLPMGAALIWLWPHARHARWIALITVMVDLMLAINIVIDFDQGAGGFQFIERGNWIPLLNAQYLLGVDGISVLFLPLTVVLFIGVILASWNTTSHMQRLYYSMLLLLESATLGVFCALDGILFFLFWELTLIPLYLLISFWGVGPNRRYAAVKYTLFMLAGGIPLLFGFVLLAFNHAEVTHVAIPAGLTFDYLTWLKTPVANDAQSVIFFLLLLGFAVKTPIVPLHTWLPVVSMQGPVSVAATLVGLKLGAYGLIRFVIPLAPEAAKDYAWLLASIGTIGVLYGAIVAMAQTNLRRMLAFSSISHVGLVVLGIASLTQQGLQGAVFQMINFIFVAGGLFLLTGMLHHRTGSTDVISLGGAAKSMPLMASFFLLFGLAAMGIPGTSGFPAEFLMIYAVITTHTGAGLAALVVVIISAVYFLGAYRKTFWGPVKDQTISQASDLQTRELIIMSVFALFIIVAGFYPAVVLDITDATAQTWVRYINVPAR